jgi:hypothetical protein
MLTLQDLLRTRTAQQPLNKAMYFNGTNAYVEVKHSSVLEPTNITAILWINPFWLHTPTAVALITKRTDYGNGYFMFWYATTKTINFDWGGNAYRWDTGYSPPLNTWTFLAFTRDSSGMKLYVNGSLYSSTTSAGGNPVSGSVLRIGMDTITPQYWYQGYIAQTEIKFSRSLKSYTTCSIPTILSGMVLFCGSMPVLATPLKTFATTSLVITFTEPCIMFKSFHYLTKLRWVVGCELLAIPS